jgi:rare lipoprotein A (peptidoglycan hydrolase)
MKKYFLTLATVVIHNLINVSTFNVIVNKTEPAEPEIKEVETDDALIKEDSLEYVKKPNVHSATWYNMHGHKTASGERFHKDSLTAAYNFSKLGTYLRVTNTSTNLSIIVKVNDRMGYRGSNHIDLSKCAFDSIGNVGSGRINVIVEEIINR